MITGFNYDIIINTVNDFWSKIMTLDQFAESLKQELKKNYSQQAISLISEKINKATINGRSLTLDEKEKILDIVTHTYIGGKKFLCDSDNSAWLNAVAILRSQVIGTKKK